MTFRGPLARRRVAALLACSLIATTVAGTVPRMATAEYGIPPGSGAVITAGLPLLVRVTPGYDAAVAYEIADGSSLTVWDVAQAAPDGSMWYPVDGGFVPVDGVTSLATLVGGVSLYQEAAPAAEEWVDPAATQGWVDPATGQWVDPTASQAWGDPNTGQWVDPAATQGWVEPNTGQWVEPVADGWADPNTGEWIALAQEVPAKTDEWIAAAPSDGWVDPTTGHWVAAPAAEGTEPAEELAEPAPADSGTVGGLEPWGEPIATAYIAGTNGGGAACRAAPDRGTSKIAVLGEGEAIEVRGEAVGEWQPVNCAGVGGYVNTSFVSWDPGASYVELEQRRRNRDRDKHGNAGNAGIDGKATSSGQQIANFAMQYVGYPYAYAGEGPYAFDCSGLVKFVVLNTLGIDVSHDLFTQYEMGQWVDRQDLRPGDLVFFQNTFRPGLSHNGIYTGGGQFVHSENEATGVKVSDLNSDYYSSRWYGAVRLT